MLDCQCLYRDNYSANGKKVRFVPNNKGCITIPLHIRQGYFDGLSIHKLLSDIEYIRKTYGRGCRTIILSCNRFVPKDKLTYIILECVIYNLTFEYGIKVHLSFRHIAKEIDTEGILDGIIHNYKNYVLNQDMFQKDFVFIQNKIHFRRIITVEQSNGVGISNLLSELRLFF